MPGYQTQYKLFKFPMKGVHVVGMKNEQPEGTCIDAQNVRPYDNIEDRARGGNRPGLARYFATTLNTGAKRVQDLNYITTISSSLAVGSMSRRTIIPVAVSDGVIQKFSTSSVTNATVAGTQALGNATQSPFAFSAELFQKLYYCDGFGYKVYAGSNNAAYDWTPTAGSLPGDQGNNIVARLIEQWRGRIVLSGLASDPHNWFMSKLGDPLDWQYFAVPETELDAVQGGNGFIGKVPDVVNAIVPYSDDVLIFGCDHSIWMMSGDPQAGGRLDLVTNTVGMSFGRPYTQLPDGTLFFFSNRGSVYKMLPGGGKPQSVTEGSIDPLITNTNLNTHIVRMAYDEDSDGVHMYITPLTNGAATHWFYDLRTEGWFKVKFGSNGHNPIALMIFDGDAPSDRKILLGTETGHVNVYSTSSYQDAGDNFTAYAVMGPIVEDQGRTPTVLTDLQFVMDDTAANTKFEIGEGDTAEAAIDNFTATFTGERHQIDNSAYIVQSGKSVNFQPRTRGYFQYFKIGTTAPTGNWAIEYIQAKYRIVKSSKGRNFLTEEIFYNAPGDPPWVNNVGLIFGYYADKNLTSVSGTVRSWTVYQQGDTANTKPALVNTGASQPTFTSSDSTMNSKASVTVDGPSLVLNTNAALLGMDNTQGWIIMSGYCDGTDAGVLFKSKLWPTSANLIQSIVVANSTHWGLQIDTTVGGSTTHPAVPTRPIALNVGTIVSFGRITAGSVGWVIRINGTSIGNWNVDTWWDDVDTGAGLKHTIGEGCKFTFSSVHAYVGAKTNAQVRAIEDTIAAFYDITLD